MNQKYNMQLSVPFYESTKETDCGPQCLRMVCEHLNKKISLEKAREIVRSLDSGMVWTLGIARGAAKLNLNVQVISSNKEEQDNEFYDKYANNQAMYVLKELKIELKELKVPVITKNLNLIDIQNYISKGICAIALINWNIIESKEGFFGHFIVIVGFDEQNIYIHNPGIEKAQEYMPIDKRLFLRAWQSKGTDKDLVILSEK